MTTGENTGRKTEIAVWVAYYCTITLFTLGAFLPGGRTWGFDWWAVFPGWAIAAIIVLLVALPWLSIRFAHDDFAEKKECKRLPLVLAVGLPVAIGFIFYLFRTQTHFGGDGYALLAESTGALPWEKGWRQIGEVLAHFWLSDLLRSIFDEPRLGSYRIISIASGVATTILTMFFAGAVFQDRREQLIYLASLMSAGYALLFFGYAENYSLFLLSVIGFIYAGLLVLAGKLRLYYMIPIMGAAIFLHVFGVILIPAGLYLFVEKGGGASTRRIRSIAASILLMALVATAVYLYITSLFVRLSLLPVISDVLTTDGYTLLSIDHLLDFVNLIFMLVPSILAYLLIVFWVGQGDNEHRKTAMFITTMCVTGLVAAFIFDPKLGMARDWDLFAFAGVPIVIGGSYLVLRGSGRYVLLIALTCIVLNLSVLVPRVVVANTPAMAETRFQQYLNIAGQRGRTGFKVLIDYYLKEGRLTAADSVKAVRLERYPEITLVADAIGLHNQGHLDSAETLLERAVAINPRDYNAWANLGEIYVQREQYDTAQTLLRLARGLNPGNASILNNLAFAHFYSHNDAEAEKLWLQAMENDTTKIGPLIGMAQLEYKRGDLQTYERYFVRIIRHTDAPLNYVQGAIDYWASWGNWELARNAFRRAQEMGMDSVTATEYLSNHPNLLSAD